MLDKTEGCASVVACTVIVLAAATLWAGPQGGVTTAGSATIDAGDRGTVIRQHSDRAIIEWDRFSVEPGRFARFKLDNPRGATLNRVTGGELSHIAGTLRSNGRLFLINPAGVVVGPDGVIDARSFTAATLDLDDARFLRDDDLLLLGEGDGAIVNHGAIIGRRGDVHLIASRVENHGTIDAPGGTVGLAAGSRVLLMREGERRLRVRVGVEGAAIDNAGAIRAAAAELEAAGGNPYALAINNDGLIRATGIEQRNGRVILRAPAGATQHGGTIDAPGGTVHVLGEYVTLTPESRIDVSGDTGGGTVLVGGDYHGDNPRIDNARRTLVDFGATIRADALRRGDGGKVVLWADDDTRFGGFISARGAPEAGDGGFVEVSGKQTLTYRGQVDVAAPAGAVGALLLDPENVTIASGVGASPPSGDWGTRDVTNNITIYEDDLEAFAGALYISADNNLIINDLADNELTLQATSASFMANNETGLTNQGGVLMLDLNDTIRMTAAGASITFQGGQIHNAGSRSASIDIGHVITNGGDVSLLVKRASAALPIFAQNVTTSGGDFIVDRIDLANSNNVSFTAEGLIDTGGGNVTVSLIGNININGGINLGAGTLTFSGTNTNLSSGITATGDVAINAVLNFSAGASISTDGAIIFTDAANMNAGGTLTLSGSDFDFQGTFAGNGGTLTLQPNTVAGDMAIDAATFANLDGFSSVTLGRADGTGTATLSGNIAISDPFTLVMGGAGGTIDQTGTISGSDDASVTYTAGGTITVGDTIDVPDGLTFTAPTIHINAAIDAGAGDVTLTVGTLTFTDDLAGDGALHIQPFSVSDDITINASTFLNLDGFTSYTIGRADGTGTATISGALAIGDPLTVVMGGVGGTINQTGTVTGIDDASLTYAAGAAIDINGAIDVPAGVSLTAPSVLTSAAIDAGSGDLIVTADTVALGGALGGTGELHLLPTSNGATIGLGDGAAGTFNLTSAEVDQLQGGFAQITIGNAAGTGDIAIQDAAFKAPLLIRAPLGDGDITIHGALSNSGGPVTLAAGDTLTIAAAGSISTDAGDVTLDADGAGTGSGAIVVRGGISTDGGAIRFEDGTYLAADLDSSTATPGRAGGDVDFTGQVLLSKADGVRITTTGPGGAGDVTFAGLLDSANTYTLVTTALTWNAARTAAASGPGDQVGDSYLVTITSALENAIVVSTAAGNQYWLGGSDAAVEGQWRWVTGPEGLEEGGAGRQFWQGAAGGSAVGGAYENWNAGEPNNVGNEDALQAGVTVQGYWNDLPSNSSTLFYMRETNAAPTTLTLDAGDVTFHAAVGSNKALGDLAVTTSGAMTTSAAVTVDGAFIHDGTGSASVGADITAGASIALHRAAALTQSVELAAPAITTTAGGTLSAAGHDLTLTADSLALGADVTGSGDLRIQPLNAGTTIGLGDGAAGTLHLTAAELARLRDGFDHVTFGRIDAGDLDVRAWTSDDSVTLRTAGDVTIHGPLAVTVNGLTINSDGEVTQTAPISTDALRLLGAGAFTLDHVSNAIDRLAADLTGGDLLLVNGTDLVIGSVDGTDGVTHTGGSVTIRAAGALTLDEAVAGAGGGSSVVLATDDRFVNHAGAAAIDPGAGRFLVYSVSPDDNTLGGLVYDDFRYNHNYTDNPPASIADPGDLLLYAIAPMLTFTADDKSKVYGAAMPVLTYSVTGLLAGDLLADAVSGAPVLATAADAASDAGTYLIDISIGTLTANLGYQLAFVDGELQITPAPLTVTADDLMRAYGVANAFTANVVGLVNGDTASDVGLSYVSAGRRADVGTYAITPAISSDNYDLTAVAGTLTIVPAPLTIAADDLIRHQYVANPSLTVRYTGLRPWDGPGVVSGLTVATTADPQSPPGAYPITVGGATAGNYAITFAPGQLTVLDGLAPEVISRFRAIQDTRQGVANDDLSARPPTDVAARPVDPPARAEALTGYAILVSFEQFEVLYRAADFRLQYDGPQLEGVEILTLDSSYHRVR